MNSFDPWMRHIFEQGGTIVDIGGGLNIAHSNRANNPAFLKNQQYLTLNPNTKYMVLDKLNTYRPDIVADVRHMPFADNEVDAFICWRILEYIETPHEAIAEILRCLKPGGQVFFEFLFIQCHSSVPGYYTDFYRFTDDGIKYLLRDFKEITIEPTMSALSSWLYLAFPKIEKYSPLIDKLRPGGKSVRGYRVLATKK